MRKEIYQAIAGALLAGEDAAVRHVDLWNHNVEFIEQEEAWPRPAVFVEFAPIEWKGVKGGVFHARSLLRLHIVTDWPGPLSQSAAALDVFDLCERVRRAVMGLSGESFGSFQIVGSDTNHNHEDIVESIETFAYSGEWRQ